MIEALLPAGSAAVFAAALMPIAIRTRWLGHDTDFASVQKLHSVSTSRLGGFNVFIGYLAALSLALAMRDPTFAPALPMLLCALPVIMAGLWEDIAGSVQPWHRLGAAVVSGVLASHFAGGVVARLDLPVIDGWLEYLPFALPLTWFMVAGACNAMNLIDGAHGLAGGVALLMFGGLAAAGFLEGDRFVFVQSLAVMGAIVGFLVWNYPRGKVFLGDAGAYFLGFMYAELSIQVVARNPGISAWYVIALAAYPITETLYSIYRRKLVLRTESMQPDADHLHSLVYRRLIVRAYLDHSAEPVRNANARVAPRMWLHAAICLGGALLLRDNTPALIAFAALYATFYVACYRTLARDLGKGRSPRNPATRARQAIRR